MSDAREAFEKIQRQFTSTNSIDVERATILRSDWELAKQYMTAHPQPIQHPDDEAVDRFARAMKVKLAKKRGECRGGWDDPQVCPPGRLQQMLIDHLTKGDPVDIGNFAMMIWNRGEAVTGSTTPQADGWVRCEDRLPEFTGWYLVTLTDPDDIGWSTSVSWAAFWNGDAFEECDPVEDGQPVTHWMPFPQPPAGQGGAGDE